MFLGIMVSFNRGSVSLVTARSRVSDASMSQLRAVVPEGDALSLRTAYLRRLSDDEMDSLHRKFLSCEAGFLCDYIIDSTVYFESLLLPSRYYDALVDYVVSRVMARLESRKDFFKDDYERDEERGRVFSLVSGRLDFALKGDRVYMVVFGSLDTDAVETIDCIDMGRYESDEDYRLGVCRALSLDNNVFGL